MADPQPSNYDEYRLTPLPADDGASAVTGGGPPAGEQGTQEARSASAPSGPAAKAFRGMSARLARIARSPGYAYFLCVSWSVFALLTAWFAGSSPIAEAILFPSCLCGFLGVGEWMMLGFLGPVLYWALFWLPLLLYLRTNEYFFAVAQVAFIIIQLVAALCVLSILL